MAVNQSLLKDDLYQAVNGEWLKEAVIPEDQPSTGGFSTLADRVEDLCLDETKKLAAGELSVTDPAMLEYIKLFQQATDYQKREVEGFDHARALLDRILNHTDYQGLKQEIVAMLKHSLPSLIQLTVEPDMKDANQHAVYLDVPQMILPDTPYYEADNETGQELLKIYQEQSVALLTKLGYQADESQQWVEDCLAFDHSLAKYQKTKEELADYTKNYNPRSIETIESYSQNIDLKWIIQACLDTIPNQVIVTQPQFFEKLSQIVEANNFNRVKAWLLVKMANAFSEILSEEMRLIGSKYLLALSGIPEAVEKDKHNFYLVSGIFEQVFGVYYGKKFFGKKARQDVKGMIEAMIKVYQERLANNQWLSQQTIDLAIKKLNRIGLLVGFPDDYPAFYKELKVNPDQTFFKNFLSFKKIHQLEQFSQFGQAVDRNKWLMPANQVNAYYNPTSNNICFPAAILQSPFYSLEQSRASNYGGIGAVIAHEISHAFDNNGAKIDEDGNLNNWWTDEDFEAFDAKAQAMIKQWDGIPFREGTVNGKLTVSENIADGGGLTAALNALKNEGETEYEDFFINWARVWSQKARLDYEMMLLQIDVHSPNELRANVAVKNLDEFYETFAIEEGDGMWLPPEDRVRIW